ncbi:MAG: hypothetical protein CR978_01230 [Gammaproteobacteria bacterium]|nr:MAG: hypothetical protein CR978_01230 [Gammaproteobacteria bacterium]
MMRRFSLVELQEPLNATLVGADLTFSAVSSDSRTLMGGELFVALVGEQFDGHSYVKAAAEKGAAALLLSRKVDTELPYLLVDDTLQALGKLGAFNRDLFAGKVVGITGSAGKTTTKNLVASVLSQAGGVHATAGNFNNEIGVPLTLLGLEPSAAHAVIEMGATGAGDIAYLRDLVKPQVVILLNAMPAHLQGFGSIAGVAAAKGEILDNLSPEHTAILPSDSPYTAPWSFRAKPAQVLHFGFEEKADVWASNVVESGVYGSTFDLHYQDHCGRVSLQLHGSHNIKNALAAAAAGFACGLSFAQIVAGLESLTPHRGRLMPMQTPSGACVIDDSYNANPASVNAAIDLLARIEGRRHLLLGAMAELGGDARRLHAEVGAYAASRGIDQLWAVGHDALPAVSAFGDRGRHFESMDSLLDALAKQLPGAGETVLVKGSRSAGMERAVAVLTQKGGC